MKDLITIIIPVYNAENYISRCLDSVIYQTYKNLEIILVNDGSTDSSGVLCDEYAVKDPRIRVIHKENGGVSSARNRGLEYARGDFIGFVDSDDWADPHMFQVLYQLCMKYNTEISMCGYFFDKDNKVKPAVISLPKEGLLVQKEAYERVLLPGNFQGHLCNKLFSAQLLDSGHLRFIEDIHYCEDLLFVCQALKCVEKVSYTTQSYYHYVVNDNSATHTVNYKFLTKIDAYNRIVCELEGTENEDIAKAATANACASTILMISGTECYSSDLQENLYATKKKYKREFLRYFPSFKHRLKFYGVDFSEVILQKMYQIYQRIRLLCI